MSFSRYEIEKRQISLDRGVTWEDVTPSETRNGELIGVARTLLECEDLACDLTGVSYTLVEGELPEEICYNGIKVLPYGIAKHVKQTAGAYCCYYWQNAGLTMLSHQTHRDMGIAAGRAICGNGYCPSYGYGDEEVHGGEVHTHVSNICDYDVFSCFMITEYMPWAEGKTSWKLIQKQNLKRGHCSEDWVNDGDPVIVGVAERWVYVDETFNDERWVHQIASEFDESGNVTTWVDGEYVYYHVTDLELPSSIELIDYVRGDGESYYVDRDLKESKDSVFGKMVTTGERSGHFSGKMHWYYKGGYYAGDYFVDDCEHYGTTGNAYGYYTTSSYQQPGIPVSDGSCYVVGDIFNIVFSPSMFALSDLYVTMLAAPTVRNDVIDGDDPANGVKLGKLIYEKAEELTYAFPYRIRENRGQQDDYYNSSEIGMIRRDGTKMVFRRLT